MEYDEQKAIEYIRENALKPMGVDYEDDEILNIIDMIYDFYEDNGLLDISMDDEEDDDDISALLEYIKKLISKDKAAKVSVEHIEPIVKAELDYEDTLI